MEVVQMIINRYEQYIEDVSTVYATASPLDGLLGWGNDPRNHPCHMQFYKDIEEMVRHISVEEHNSAISYHIVHFMLTAPLDHKDDPTCWFMLAAQALCKDLIPSLNHEHRNLLKDLLEESYQRRDWTPVQKNLHKLLRS